MGIEDDISKTVVRNLTNKATNEAVRGIGADLLGILIGIGILVFVLVNL